MDFQRDAVKFAASSSTTKSRRLKEPGFVSIMDIWDGAWGCGMALTAAGGILEGRGDVEVL